MTGRGRYMQGRGGFFGGLAGLLTGKGWKAGSDAGDALWESTKHAIPIPAVHKVMELSDVANQIAAPIAEMSGRGMYKRPKRQYAGRGEYVATNGLITDGRDIVPQFGQHDLKSTVITNREFVSDIFAPSVSAPFSVTEYPINPGIGLLWKWLSQIAINFEEYELKQCIVTFKSTVADFASQSGQVGQVIMATQYNPTADKFATKDEMMLYEGGMSCKTTQSMQHGIECDPAKLTGQPFKYIRIGSLPTSEDLKEYDLGKLSIATTGIPATYSGQQIGELWVSYTVELRRPRISSEMGYNLKRDIFMYKNYLAVAANSPPVPLNWLRGAKNYGFCTVTNPVTSAAIKNTADHLNYGTPATITGHTAAPQLCVIRFAPSFNGIVQIRFRYMSNNAAFAASQLYIGSSDEPGTAGWTPCIFRFYDIPVKWTQNAAAPQVFTHIKLNVENTDTFNEINFGDLYREAEIHLRIVSPRNGQVNEIYFAQNHQTTNTSVALTCEVTQYNTYLSQNDSGANDSIPVVNQASGLPDNWVQS